MLCDGMDKHSENPTPSFPDYRHFAASGRLREKIEIANAKDGNGLLRRKRSHRLRRAFRSTAKMIRAAPLSEHARKERPMCASFAGTRMRNRSAGSRQWHPSSQVRRLARGHMIGAERARADDQHLCAGRWKAKP